MSHQPSLPGTGLHVAFVTMRTSPLERARTADAGSMNVLTAALARVLGRLDVWVDFLTHRTDPDQPERKDVAPSVTLRRLPAGPSTPLPKSEIDQHVGKLREAMEALKPRNLVHSCHWMSGVTALSIIHAWGVPHVIIFHSVATHPNSPPRDGEPPESPTRVDDEMVCAEQSDLMLCVSRHRAAVVIGRCEAGPERVRIARPDVGADLFHPATHPQASPGVRPGYVASAARLQPLKAPGVAIRTMACLPDAIRPDLTVVDETSTGSMDYKAELHALVGGLGLRGQVHSLPDQNRESLIRIVRHASMMLVSSHPETPGLVTLEVSASKVPVLAAASEGLTEAICSTHTGLPIPTRDPRMWAGALEALLVNEPRRKLLGAAGRRRASVTIWEHAAENTLQQYWRIL